MIKNSFLNLIIFITVLNFSNQYGLAQSNGNSQMFLYEVDGNTYVKKDYSKNGTMTGKQILKVGSVQESENGLQMPVNIFTYDNDGTLTDSTQTTYTCNPDDRTILVNLIPFTEYGSGSEIQVNRQGPIELYPVAPNQGWSTEPVNIDLKLSEGLIGFLGGNSKIELYNRKIVENDTLSTNQYEIESDVTIKAYVFRIRVKTIRYKISEIVDPSTGIIKQIFQEDSGNYFTVELK